ncbi:MAG: hypothetical protein A2W18_14975 [Candidatus Muproteobacteria bacterium RBG_16_60_9]|uniref:Cytochrome c domain-containing protein n=1 Tax=Candidatus Muproteobacteria bacterium RBG_16_60_9 TaxID=1817755 RepID=A0A1F6UWG2_9PROT|nr:MAG: hypothetical protein A2W18_14975 [Candidatus Muproteobacteria bacterium RBG_16_60_9]
MRLSALFFLAATPALAGAGEPAAKELEQGKQLFEIHCRVCHSLDLPRSQHLDRNNWEWVMEDMVQKFGATWITLEQRQLIVDYLVTAHGPKR